MWRLWRKKFNGGIHVCGCGHSGTSILTRIIAAHPQIYGLPVETGIARKENYTKYRNNVLKFEEKTASEGLRFWVEKTPKHVRNLRFILDCAPSTKIVLISRNPKDTVASLKRRYGNIGKSIRRWKSDNRRVLRWAKHPQCISILYEDLVTQPELTMTRVMDFLGFSFETEQLNFHDEPVEWYVKNEPTTEELKSGHSEPETTEITSGQLPLDESEYGTKIPHTSYRNMQINQPLFNNIGSFRKYLSEDEASKVWRACASIAIALGYPSDGSI
ncbi:MAG: sulfotransferase [Planctomycetota bacterium]|nr:sulfotransferase [Planctomycetota bacterium]